MGKCTASGEVYLRKCKFSMSVSFASTFSSLFTWPFCRFLRCYITWRPRLHTCFVTSLLMGGFLCNSVITTPEDLRTFSLDGEKHGKHSNLGWFLDQLLGRCIGFLEGNEWKQKRQIFYPAFSFDGTAMRVKTTESAASKFIEDLPSMHSDRLTTNRGRKTISFQIADGFRKFPLYVTASVIYGDMTETEKDDLWHLAEKRLALWPYTVIGGPYRFSWGNWFDRKTYGHLNEYTKEWRNYNDRMVQTRRDNGVKTPLISFYDAYEAGNVTLENVSHLSAIFINLG